MIDFEMRYLRCGAVGFKPDDLFFSSGPDRIHEPFTSDMVSSIIEYQSEEMAAAISALPGFVKGRNVPEEKTWRWEQDGSYIEVIIDDDNTDENGVWLASRLSADCTFAELVTVCSHLRRSHPAVYLHDQSCRMYTPRSFLEEPAMRALSRAILSEDPHCAARAEAEFEMYRALADAPRLWQPYWHERTPNMVGSVFDLAYPIVPLACNDIWRGDDWESRAKAVDAEAAAQGIKYFAHPTSAWLSGKFKSGFMVWSSWAEKDAVRQIVSDLGILSDRQP